AGVFARVQVADLFLNLRVDAVAGEVCGHADGVLHGLGVRAAVLARVRQPDMPCARCRALRAGLRSARAADVCAQLMPAELKRFIARHYPDRLLPSAEQTEPADRRYSLE